MLKLTTDKHEASRGLSATAELLVYLDFCNVPPQLCDGSTVIHDICSSSSSM